MNSILLKVQKYLDQVSKSPTQVDKKLVEEFGEACKKALLKQFTEDRSSKFELRMSNVGRPLCQLQMEAKGIKGEGQPYNVKVRNTFGDMIEALALFIMKSAGVEIKNEQKQVKYKFNGEEIEGRQDVEIDEKIWDIKSASPYSFEKKFGEDGGFNEVVKDDTFGYASQGFLYGESQKKNFGGWIVINKSTGEWAVCETPKLVEPYKSDAIKKAKDNVKAIKDGIPFKRQYDAIEETFRGKPTGNKVLGLACSFCPYKLPCWGSKLQLLPQQQSKGKNPKWVWYTEVNNPKRRKSLRNWVGISLRGLVSTFTDYDLFCNI
ncbi:MAG: hypothetical protein CM15mV121_250 [uncultured marine virus]|nr:MAG: hypothetical protein CM15mV121_250 [uncultured marine virus]